jgi:hypothetical protein
MEKIFINNVTKTLPNGGGGNKIWIYLGMWEINTSNCRRLMFFSCVGNANGVFDKRQRRTRYETGKVKPSLIIIKKKIMSCMSLLSKLLL